MILKKYQPNYKVFNEDFSFLFNSYYQSVGEKALRSNRGLITRPLVEEVYAYRTYVDKHMLELLKSGHEKQKINELVTLGIHHEQQHQELLLTDLKYTFSFNPTFPIYKKDSTIHEDTDDKMDWITLKKGQYEIGHQGTSFCFDNELDAHSVYLNEFQIATSLVSNTDYIEFIENGGYQHFSYWLDEAWSWVNEHEIKAPLYWKKIDNEWYHYTLAGLKKVNRKAILTHVSHYEASAFAAYKNMRLPTEFEWEAAADKFKWGKRWEWTNSAYLPYPNYKVAEGAVGEYNGKFMINQMVLRGASSASSKGHSRKTYRNFFHPKYRWQFTGIRLAK